MTVLSQTGEYKTSSYFTGSSIKAPGYGDGGKERGMQFVLRILPIKRCDYATLILSGMQYGGAVRRSLLWQETEAEEATPRWPGGGT